MLWVRLNPSLVRLVKANYVFKPTAEQALRSIQPSARRRLNTALDLHACLSRVVIAWITFDTNRGKKMGCWDIGSFANDCAMDWLGDLLGTRDLSLAREAIECVLATEGYLDSPYATDALAAIEVILCALGRPTNEALRQEKLLSWVSEVKPKVDKELIGGSVRAIARILGPESELLELWEDTEDADEWKAEVNALRAGLQA